MIRTILPENKDQWLTLRTPNINSTDVSALFGISPYSTYFELWHRKNNNQYVSIEPNERMKWGTALERAIAEEIAKEQGWEIRHMPQYMYDPDLRIGASFDFSIIETIDISEENMLPGSECVMPMSKDVETGLLEIKNVDSLVFKNDWIMKEDGSVEAPLHIEIQCQHQMLVSGRPFLYIGALIGGNRQILIKRIADQRVHDAIKQKVAEFWASVEAGLEPKPDFEADAEFIKSLYSFAEPGTTMDVSNDARIIGMAEEYESLGDVIKTAETRRDAIKAELLTIIGTTEKAYGTNFTISAGVIGPSWVEAYERKGYRSFKVTFKKAK